MKKINGPLKTNSEKDSRKVAMVTSAALSLPVISCLAWRGVESAELGATHRKEQINNWKTKPSRKG